MENTPVLSLVASTGDYKILFKKKKKEKKPTSYTTVTAAPRLPARASLVISLSHSTTSVHLRAQASMAPVLRSGLTFSFPFYFPTSQTAYLSFPTIL